MFLAGHVDLRPLSSCTGNPIPGCVPTKQHRCIGGVEPAGREIHPKRLQSGGGRGFAIRLVSQLHPKAKRPLSQEAWPSWPLTSGHSQQPGEPPDKSWKGSPVGMVTISGERRYDATGGMREGPGDCPSSYWFPLGPLLSSPPPAGAGVHF